MQAGNPKGVTGRDGTLCGPTIAVTLSGIQESRARADAIYDSPLGAVMLLEKVPGCYEGVGEGFEQNIRIGMAVPKGDTKPPAALEAALAEIIADGTNDALVAKWNLPASVSILNRCCTSRAAASGGCGVFRKTKGRIGLCPSTLSFGI